MVFDKAYANQVQRLMKFQHMFVQFRKKMSLEVAKNNKRREEEKDPITYLRNECPRILEFIFGELLTYKAFLEMQKVPRWKEALSNTWKRRWVSNMIQSPMWRMLSLWITTNNPSLIDRLDSPRTSGYQDLCLCIEEVSQMIKKNLEHGVLRPVQEEVISASRDKYTNQFSYVSGLTLTHQHIYVLFCIPRLRVIWRIKMYHRWRMTPLKSFDSKSPIRNLQMNSRVAVFLTRRNNLDSVYVLDVNTLELIQTISGVQINTLTTSGTTLHNCLALTERKLCFVQMVNSDDKYAVIVFSRIFEFNRSSCCFDLIEENSVECKVDCSLEIPKMYIDDRLLILDSLKMEGTRNIQVRSVNTLNLVNDRDFGYSMATERGYVNGKVMGLMSIDKTTNMVWDVYNNILERPANMCENYCAMTHFSDYRVAFDAGDRGMIKSIKKTQDDSEKSGKSTVAHAHGVRLSSDWHFRFRGDSILYCDGAQVIAAPSQRNKLYIINLI